MDVSRLRRFDDMVTPGSYFWYSVDVLQAEFAIEDSRCAVCIIFWLGL